MLLVALAVFLYTCARGDVQLTALEEVQEQLGEATAKQLPYWQIVLWLLLGLALLPLGADFVVKSGSSLALSWGISEAVIGLTIVALGTSLPELATTVAAAFRKSIDVALGNVVFEDRIRNLDDDNCDYSHENDENLDGLQNTLTVRSHTRDT